MPPNAPSEACSSNIIYIWQQTFFRQNLIQILDQNASIVTNFQKVLGGLMISHSKRAAIIFIFTIINDYFGGLF